MLSKSFLDTIKRYTVVLDQEDKYIRDFDCVVCFGKKPEEVLSDCFVDSVNAMLDDADFIPESYNYEDLAYMPAFFESNSGTYAAIDKRPTLHMCGRYWMRPYMNLQSEGIIDCLQFIANSMPAIKINFQYANNIGIHTIGSFQQYGLGRSYQDSYAQIEVYVDEIAFPKLADNIIKKFEKLMHRF